jgi:hypothetical protein
MTPIETELRRLITEARESGRTLKSITDAAGIGYFRCYNWLNGRSPVLDVGIADRLYRSLGGKGFTK